MLISRLVVVAVLAALAGCREGGPTGPLAEPASIVLSSTTVDLSWLTATHDLTATVLDDGGSAISGVTVTWSTDASAVATVSIQGRVTAVGNGTAEITAAVGALAATAVVTVRQIPTALVLSPDTLRLAGASATGTLTAVVEDAGGSEVAGVDVAFSSADAAVATVDVVGLVTAQGDGATYVTGQVAPGGSALTESVRVEVGTFLDPAYLVGGYVGVAYGDRVGPATGSGTFSYSVTAGALPAGLSLDPVTAEITGTPTASGIRFFQVSASNGPVTVSERFAITISTNATGAFNLWVTYDGGVLPPVAVEAAVSAALARWEGIVTGDAGAAITYPATGLDPDDCSLVDASLLNGAFIEDVAILMAFDAIDGPGRTLARGGPCGYGRSHLPAVISGQLLLDAADAAIVATSFLEDIVWHEIAHALGMGTLWQSWTTGVGTPQPLYVGELGNEEWLALGGLQDGVPLEPDLGVHWDEAWFDNELMTPVAEATAVAMPVSRLTIGALLDMGWIASLGAADPYVLPACAGSCAPPAGVGEPSDSTSLPDYVIDRLLPLP